jgi:predicted alpha/beta hydrolase family esterase
MQSENLVVVPDVPDLRDRVYSPTLRWLAPQYNPKPFQDKTQVGRVKNQKQTSACTGFALAALIEMLTENRWLERKDNSDHPGQYSPFMLYAMARRYDDLPGESAHNGSTARGAMKAWHKHGASRFESWPKIGMDYRTADQAWVRDAFKTPLGAYYRVDHSSIPDVHAAIQEAGAVFATARVHQGWRELLESKGSKFEIPFNSATAEEIGGHAFLIVGYDENGFWIQNSWGQDWGHEGFARLSYADWQVHAMDTWIAQLGVHISSRTDELGQGLSWRGASGVGVPGIDLLSSSPSVSAQQINPYIVDLGNNGKLSETGQFRTTREDLGELTGHYLDKALEQFKQANTTDPVHVAIYAHGGLTSEASAATTARLWIPGLFASRVFPIFMMWETGLIETLGDLIEDKLKGTPGAAGASFWDRALDWVDDRLEGLAAPLGTPIWDEIKQNAEFASSNREGGLEILLEKLIKKCDSSPGLRERLRFHLIGHSAGAIFQAHLLGRLLEAQLTVDGLYLMAPAIRVDDFKRRVLPHYQDGRLKAFTQFHLSDVAEQNDNCLHLYHKSLLYLVSNAFERRRQTPILGMERFFAADPELSAKPAGAEVWDTITAPTPPSADPRSRSLSTSHGGFDDDQKNATMIAVLERIKGRRT